MPYIHQEDRERLDNGGAPRTAGELNYKFCKLAADFVKQEGLRYETLNAAMGAFSGASQEFYRRLVAPYEQQKVAENGDLEWFPTC
jgi:hypothetical protein